jgi:hypothetical protein
MFDEPKTFPRDFDPLQGLQASTWASSGLLHNLPSAVL